MKSKLKNYLGQLRLYSLVDLILMMFAATAPLGPIFGAVMLHVGFLAFLESRHKQPGREPVIGDLPWALCVLIGGTYFGAHHQNEIVLYLCCSIQYARKKDGRWGLLSPFFRGAQVFALTSPFADFRFSVVAAIATAIRNALGDWRDVNADRYDAMKTWPVILGVKDDWHFLHLGATIATTWLWWLFTEDLSIFCPASLTLIEFRTYYLTPRNSNARALIRLRGFARRLHLVA
ncbi:MAG: hypothetical protein A2751_02445 [Candidatus Doudnabacteria bacterium RIFCSPHIGHO2_01_FULL_46_14]|uniref:Uncharacterized protein n=1 Tax=Candidatus Doudnabacteria bacterium RIFCSPHIGHO2_01_FULL_46_14 TaxID=1817824 RepID=A0A1F5NJJ6_9BACT|nr:MAG: hypothetical protein A2751_02445 [Candidatus Doudnabacteria bacterium RIFCSPHIGHO2_01_FULL_46_14]